MSEAKVDILDIEADSQDVLHLFFGSTFYTVAEEIRAINKSKVFRDISVLGIIAVHTTKEVVHKKLQKLIKNNETLADFVKRNYHLKDSSGHNLNMTKFVLTGIIALESEIFEQSSLAKRLRVIYDATSPYGSDLEGALISEEKRKIFTEFKEKHPADELTRAVETYKDTYKKLK